ncbi:MAG: FecR family protein [Alphaproteobacteria bacterium]
MTTDNETILSEAIAWHVSLDSDQADWDGFTRWLEQGAEYREAYDRVALFDGDLAQLLQRNAMAIPANDDQPVFAEQVVWHRKWRRELAAALIVLLAAPLALVTMRSPQAQLYQAPADASQTIALANGSQIVLDRASQLNLIDGDVPQIELLSGAAWFDAPNNPDQSFAIRAGKTDIKDLGTQFSVSYSAGMIEIGVVDGIVAAQLNQGKPIKVTRGQQLFVDEQRGETQIGRITTSDIAAWRSGKLVYNNTPLALVAADLARYTGEKVSVDPALERERFSGALNGEGQSDVIANLAMIVGAGIERRGNEIRLVPSR